MTLMTPSPVVRGRISLSRCGSYNSLTKINYSSLERAHSALLEKHKFPVVRETGKRSTEAQKRLM